MVRLEATERSLELDNYGKEEGGQYVRKPRMNYESDDGARGEIVRRLRINMNKEEIGSASVTSSQLGLSLVDPLLGPHLVPINVDNSWHTLSAFKIRNDAFF